MRELVIVISDLYLGGEADAAPSGGAPQGLPGLERVARFAGVRAPERNWRAWCARWFGLARHAQLPPASIAAVGRSVPGESVWCATPLHLVAGVGRLHLQRRGRLQLASEPLAQLAADFNSEFGGGGFALAPLDSGECLLGAPGGLSARTVDPARVPQMAFIEALPSGADAAWLRRLGAEIELWLHAHPLNAARARRGEPQLSQLWIWGGGQAGLCGAEEPGARAHTTVFGADAYLTGLVRLAGGQSAPLEQWSPAGATSRAGAALLTLEIAEPLRRAPGGSLTEAVAALDRQWVVPALAALADGAFERMTVLANDRLWQLGRRDQLRRWRRHRVGLEALT